MSRNEGLRSVLIFGGAGFIGSNFTDWLLRNSEAQVHVFDNLSRPGVRHNLETLQQLANHTGRLQITIGDIRDAELVNRAVRPATEIYHLAAQVAVTSSIAEPRLDFDINLHGTFNILEAARKSQNRPFFLFTSTNKVYGSSSSGDVWTRASRYDCSQPDGTSELQPLDFHSPYGCSKGAADQYVRDYARIYGLNTAVFRMSCIAGPRQFGNEDQGWVAHFLYSAMASIPVTIYGNGLQVRDVLCVDDLIRAFDAVRELAPSSEGRVYNVGGGRSNTTSLLELAELIESLTGRKLQMIFDAVRPGDQAVYITDYRKLQHETGWQPITSLQETLQRIYQWWKHNREFVNPGFAAEIPAVAGTATLPRAV